MTGFQDTIQLRVRYSETDQMGTFYNSRALEWFECGRTEILRRLGFPYAQLEDRGVYLPLVEAHLEYQGRARYDDLLELTTTLDFAGRARVRCRERITKCPAGSILVTGYTIHAFTDREGRVIRPPAWFLDALRGQGLAWGADAGPGTGAPVVAPAATSCAGNCSKGNES
jgi:acyl-CoA thioester hydrolase